jgi:hypothetical protein
MALTVEFEKEHALVDLSAARSSFDDGLAGPRSPR